MDTEKIFVVMTFTLIMSLRRLVNTQECQATLQNGTVIGMTQTTVNPNRTVCAFLAIPYATPPVGLLRFKSPLPSRGWNGTFNATKHANWCPQERTEGFPMPPGMTPSEDCLKLNVFVPNEDNKTKNANLPVIIWFHGGGLNSWSAEAFGPQRLLAKADIILVVVQYRLGVLGFLSTGDLVSPGNYGLKDQALSIRWVNENIAAFGGNPNQVTVAGQSAGGVSALSQMLYPPNKDFIHGVIAQSGTPLVYSAIDRDPAKIAKDIAASHNCSTNSSEQIMSCMRELSWEAIIEIKGVFPGPVLEPPHDEAFFTEEPLETMKSGDIPKIPVLLGANKHDASIILATLYLTTFGPQGLDKDPEFMRNHIVPYIVKFLNNEEEPANRAISSSLEMAYLDKVDRSSWNASMPGLVDLLTASIFKASCLHVAEILSKRRFNVYLYSFEHHSNLSFYSGMINGPNPPPVQFGISHSDDLLYLFDLDFFGTLSPSDETFSETFVDLWTNFGKYGNPTPSDDNDKWNTWLPYNATSEAFMKLNTTPTLQFDYYSSWRPNGFQWN